MPPEGLSPPDGQPLPDPEQVLREARTKFVASFPQQVLLIERLLQVPDSVGALPEIVRIVHKISGFGGTVGLPTVSARAGDLEELLTESSETAFDRQRAFDMIAALRDAFARDLATPPGWLVERQPEHGHHLRILVVEDDRNQAAVLTSHLAAAGHHAVLVESGDLALDAARQVKPDIIVLDVELPGSDGYSVCRQLKADRAVSPVPVVFLTARSHLDDRLAGLTVGADEFLTKPVDMRELLLRLRLLAERVGTRAGPPSVDAGATSAGSPAVVRPAVPECGRRALVVEGDPDLVRLLEIELQASAFETTLAFGGRQALDLLPATAPHVVVVDLTIPDTSALEVLQAVRSLDPRPRILVLSERSRDEDVARAVELGADDALVKPFSPQELSARIRRLLT